ncbi:MAG: prolipoprotein diacylglyceryl transferase [Deltaproteobacteria bacterium]|nr:MAG: prolipoprotein diacylglyceryl transferase [Deltaproteobacteria bacterium]
MLRYPTINPTIVNLSPIQLRWYGVMYILGFLASYLLVRYQIRKKGLDIYINIVNDLFLFLLPKSLKKGIALLSSSRSS